MFENNSKCFIKNEDGTFTEISYRKLKELRKNSEDFRKKKFAKYRNMLFEINPDIYDEYNSEISKIKYWRAKEDSIKKLSINGFIDSEDDDEYDVIPDLKVNIENDTERKLELDALNKALLSLSDEEYKLIKAIFFDGISLRQYASKNNIPLTSLYRSKEKIINKLKKYLKNL